MWNTVVDATEVFSIGALRPLPISLSSSPQVKMRQSKPLKKLEASAGSLARLLLYL
jgi:hypothetical protein